MDLDYAMDLDYTKLVTVPLEKRHHKVSLKDFGHPTDGSVRAFIDSLPDILAGQDLKRLLRNLESARETGRARIWAMGAHVVKCGLTPYLVELMDRGAVTHIALNGAGIIHDFELALIGQTSEDVEASLGDGSFGMAEETSRLLADWITSDSAQEKGIGHVVGAALDDPLFPHREHSLLVQAGRRKIPVTVHPALGTEVIHYHPGYDWSRAAGAARRDFDTFVSAVTGIDGGGVYLNVGSSVILPEIFLKAVSIVRNLKIPLSGFTAVVLDMIDHYRPRENVLSRPGGCAIRILGHHEILIPLIACGMSIVRPEPGV